MAEWFEEGLDPEHLEHVTAKGWNKPLTPDIARAIATAHREAQKFIGSDPASLIRLPKDATDPSYASVYDRVVGMSTPKTADEYKFDGIAFKDGAVLDAEDAAFVRDFAAQHKLPVTAARALATALVTRSDANAETYNGQTAVAKQANDNALAAIWPATEIDRNKFAASKATDALAALGVKVSFDGLDPPAYVAAMQGLVKLSTQLDEHTILRGGGGGVPPGGNTAGMLPADARAQFDELRQNNDWITKALTPGTAEATHFANLQRVMAGGGR